MYIHIERTYIPKKKSTDNKIHAGPISRKLMPATLLGIPFNQVGCWPGKQFCLSSKELHAFQTVSNFIAEDCPVSEASEVPVS